MRWRVRLAKHTSELKKCWMLLRVLENTKLEMEMESAGGGAVLSRRSRTEVRWGDRGDSARLVGQGCSFYSPTPTREDFCQPPPPAPKRQAFWLFVWRVLVVTAGGGVLLASSGQSPGLLLLTS